MHTLFPANDGDTGSATQHCWKSKHFQWCLWSNASSYELKTWPRVTSKLRGCAGISFAVFCFPGGWQLSWVTLVGIRMQSPCHSSPVPGDVGCRRPLQRVGWEGNACACAATQWPHGHATKSMGYFCMAEGRQESHRSHKPLLVALFLTFKRSFSFLRLFPCICVSFLPLAPFCTCFELFLPWHSSFLFSFSLKIKWHHSIGVFSFHFILDCFKWRLLSFLSAPTGIVSHCSLCPHLKDFSGNFCLQLSHPSLWAGPILLTLPWPVPNPSSKLTTSYHSFPVSLALHLYAVFISSFPSRDGWTP